MYQHARGERRAGRNDASDGDEDRVRPFVFSRGERHRRSSTPLFASPPRRTPAGAKRANLHLSLRLPRPFVPFVLGLFLPKHADARRLMFVARLAFLPRLLLLLLLVVRALLRLGFKHAEIVRGKLTHDARGAARELGFGRVRPLRRVRGNVLVEHHGFGRSAGDEAARRPRLFAVARRRRLRRRRGAGCPGSSGA